MSTNLPKSRNRNLPPPPAAAAEVRHRPVMSPVQQAPEEPEPGRGILRPLLAMIVIGGLLFAGIFFYIRGVDSDVRKSETRISILTDIGRGIWLGKGMTGALTTESEERQKDLEDLPRIFMAASKKGPHITRVIEGDPSPPGPGNGTHQIHYVLADTVNIVLSVFYDAKDGKIIFLGVQNRLVPDRIDSPPADAPSSAIPAAPPAPASANAPPETPAPAPVPPSAPTEKVSEPPANPR